MNEVFTRGWFNLSIQWGLDGFMNYIDEMEDILRIQLIKLEQEYEKEALNISADQAEDLFEYNYADQFSYLKDDFPNILRKSFVTSLYSFLEQQLGKVSEQVQLTRSDDSKIPSGIFNSYKYLKKNININFDTLNDSWSKIEKINKIRNHIVHNGEDKINKIKIPRTTEDKRNNATFEAYHYFKLVEEDKVYNNFLIYQNKAYKLKYYIKLSTDFCKEILNIIRTFFDTLTNLVKEYQYSQQ